METFEHFLLPFQGHGQDLWVSGGNLDLSVASGDKSPWRGATEDLGCDVRAVDAALICSKQQIHQIRVGYGQSRVDTLYMRLARCFHANWAVFPAASVMCFPAFAP